MDYIYAIREKSTGKLRADLFHNGRTKKYWDLKSWAQHAIDSYASYTFNKAHILTLEEIEEIKSKFEVVKFKLVEVEE